MQGMDAVVNVRLREGMLAKVDALAAKWGMSRSAALKALIARFFDDHPELLPGDEGPS